MHTSIYYFSGTGNSLAIARALAEKTNGTMSSIPSAMDSTPITNDADGLGMVFPVYHKSIPPILKRFVEKLTNLDQKYIFAVYTYGDTSGMAVKHLDQLIQARGGQVAAGFGVHMPYNYVTPSPVLRGFLNSFTLREIPLDKQQALFADAQTKIEQIAASVNARETGTLELTTDILTRLADALGLPDTLGKSVWLKAAGVAEKPDAPFLECIRLMDRAFHADASCNGCGICARVCPVENIEMVDSKPAWQKRCEQCFACLHWCPQQAIQFGNNTAGKKRYHHPDVKLQDMLQEN